MRASWKWLRELLPAISLGPEELAGLLTNAGIEVESIRTYGAASRDVLVAEVVSTEPHPSRENQSQAQGYLPKTWLWVARP